ncbi:hypothetical protein BACUNI_02948 [Bacteroides uniformis ATCC 8492]|uniref:Uncharacterized protein n=1 Tax=Bacteroides uniformis (strain ATCC 8492 / DSM 6597 / CCUG 4942 / CIP 103695 / JCM 5828 / KCTC 5204 / NCTC 13054 / VPI 0061) TaxID=411479 RepID=A0ABC9NA91_BACUC|nr:hypothetical protein BACUNI_02948 [Bacteroides uniformis ATCC 8492]
MFSFFSLLIIIVLKRKKDAANLLHPFYKSLIRRD